MAPSSRTQQQFKIDLYDDVSNPLDAVEDIMMRNDWVYERPSVDELTVQVSGTHGELLLRLIWQEEFTALQCACIPDMTIPPANESMAAQTLMTINAKLWLGHFDLQVDHHGGENLIVCFRQTCLFRGIVEGSGQAVMEDLIDIAITECDRYYPTLTLLSRSRITGNPDLLALSMMDSAGQS